MYYSIIPLTSFERRGGGSVAICGDRLYATDHNGVIFSSLPARSGFRW